ncbi:MAG: MscL family protein [Candidatus Paceibacterota bacterium]
MKLLQEFQDFLQEYKIVSLALAFIIGTASTSLVQSLVNNIIMPFISPLIPSGEWNQATLNLGPIVLKWGAFLSELISFVILAFVVFVVAKKILKADKE